MIDTLPGLSEADALSTLTAADASRFRFVVQQDTEADGPIQWGHLTVVRSGIVTGSHQDDTPEGGTDPIGLRRALEHFAAYVNAERRGYRGLEEDAAIIAARRWARIFHGVEVTRWNPRGVSQSDWGDGLVYLETAEERAATLDEQRDSLDGWLTDASAWYAGEVYGVRLERDASDDGSGDWVTVEDCDLWGCYLGRTYTAADLGAEQFGLPRAFAEAVAVTYGEAY